MDSAIPPSQQPHTHPHLYPPVNQMPATLPPSPSPILQTDLLLVVTPQACQLGKPDHPNPCQSPNPSLFQQLAFCLPECMRCAGPIIPYSSECRWVRAGPGHDAAPTRCRWWSTYPAHKGKVAFTHLCAVECLVNNHPKGFPRRWISEGSEIRSQTEAFRLRRICASRGWKGVQV